LGFGCTIAGHVTGEDLIRRTTKFRRFGVIFFRVGLKTVVLERSSKLRADGAAIGLWTNAFRVLDVLGIGEKFRIWFTNLLEYVPPVWRSATYYMSQM